MSDTDPVYPIPRPADRQDARFKFGLIHEVAEVLERHGYPALSAGADLVRLQQALFTMIYEGTAP